MSLFTDATIQRMSNEGENAFAVKYKCIIRRISLHVTSGNPVITLPSDCQNIRRVTWQGYKLEPLIARQKREMFQSANQIGKPYWYQFNNIQAQTLELFPIPNQTLAGGESENTLYNTNVIRNACIVEYWAVPDFVNFTIPSYFRRRLLKSYVLRGCFSIEGQGQNLNNAKYFKSRWDFLMKQYGILLDNLNTKPRKMVVSGNAADNYFPGQPILPIDKFGISVDTGE